VRIAAVPLVACALLAGCAGAPEPAEQPLNASLAIVPAA